METLFEVAKNPSGLDSYNNYAGDAPEKSLYVLMTRNRDSDVFVECNWDCALELLGGEGEFLEVHRFGHWACGWWEALCVRKNKTFGGSGDIYNKALKLYNDLQDYPVVNEDRLSEYETEAADKVWADCYDWGDRIEYIRNSCGEFDFHDLSDMIACVRGQYFSGYASELIYN